MKETKVICNMCGNKISEIDLKCNEFSINHQFGYGSAYDGNLLRLDLCSECSSNLITYLAMSCKINPLIDTDI